MRRASTARGDTGRLTGRQEPLSSHGCEEHGTDLLADSVSRLHEGATEERHLESVREM